MIKKIPLILFFFIHPLLSQELHFSGNVHTLAYSDKEKPFWFYSNQKGRVDEDAQFSSWANFSGTFFFNENALFEMGIGGLKNDGYNSNFQIDEFFLKFQNSWLSAVVGRKQKDEIFKGLSASRKNILYSLNSRPMPGVGFSTIRPIYFLKEAGIGFEASLEEYLLDDERYIRNARIHHKSLHLVISTIDKVVISLGILHYAQWAGLSPKSGKLPGSLRDYLNVVLGRGMDGGGGEEIKEQEINALGNHLGSYELNIGYSLGKMDFQFGYNHIFEDGSGLRLSNFPDGRYSVFLGGREKLKGINSFLYEFYYTKNQSGGGSTSDGIDNYFNNHLYRSGWTYENRVIGAPFFTLGVDRFRITNNKFLVHHVGIGGFAFNIPFKILASYRKNYGAKGGEYSQTQNIFSTSLDLLVWQDIFDLNLLFGGDLSSDGPPLFGVGIHLSRNFF